MLVSRRRGSCLPCVEVTGEQGRFVALSDAVHWGVFGAPVCCFAHVFLFCGVQIKWQSGEALLFLLSLSFYSYSFISLLSFSSLLLLLSLSPLTSLSFSLRSFSPLLSSLLSSSHSFLSYHCCLHSHSLLQIICVVSYPHIHLIIRV